MNKRQDSTNAKRSGGSEQAIMGAYHRNQLAKLVQYRHG